jgi:hypothetical protein
MFVPYNIAAVRIVAVERGIAANKYPVKTVPALAGVFVQFVRVYAFNACETSISFF